MIVTVDRDAGRAVKLRGDPDHGATGGFLCVKVNRYLDRTYSDRRVLHPMKRVGAKGEGRFERIGWDEALDLVATRLGEIAARNAEAILPYSYGGTLGLVQNGSMDHRFFHRLGASRLLRTICAEAGSEALNQTTGWRVGPEPSAFARSRHILIWGSNTLTSNVHLWPFLQTAREDGARLVVIDPIRTETARRADEWIAVRPGTDAALAFGMMHVIFSEGLADRDYLASYADGGDALEARVREHWPVERAARVTGVDAETIARLAREHATTRPAAIRLNYGLQRHAGGAAAVRAVVALSTVIGAWREHGGGALLSTSQAYPVAKDRLARPDLMPRKGGALPRAINMTCLGDALDPRETSDPSVEAIVVYASNPVAVAPDQEKVIAGFARKDLFTVVHEIFMTDTARYADVVLPATTQLEQIDIHKSYGHLDVLLNTPSIEPIGEAVSNAELFRRLAARMGFDDPCFADSDEALARQAFDWEDPRMAGITYERLRDEGPQRLRLPEPFLPFARGGFFRREDGRARLGDIDYVPPAEIGDGERDVLDDRLPLGLISPPAHHFLNSSFANLDFAAQRQGVPTLEIHPDDARARDIEDGQAVVVENDRGCFEAIAVVTEGVRVGVVSAPSIFWLEATRTGRNANAVTGQRLTDLGGGATFYDCAVEVRRV